MTTNRWTVGTFYVPLIGDDEPRLSRIRAYTGFYRLDQEGCVEIELDAESGIDAKRKARLMRLALESALEGLRACEVVL